MAEVILTKEKIDREIKVYQERIHAAIDRLATLPAKGRTQVERRKLKTTRRKLLAEIEHVSQLISYAEDAMNEIH